jgi:hypothetical protein
MMIRELFSTSRPIDRRIEKVIDYYADDETRLAAEIGEYEATPNIERNFRKFLDHYQDGVQGGQVTEVGIWVSGFYGSGKSSFTKYLGFALDPERLVEGQPFLDLLAARIHDPAVQSQLRTAARQAPTAVLLLDLGAEQLAESATTAVSNVLYWKVLQSVGFSKEKKLAQLEFTLTQQGLYEPFKAAYRAKHGDDWEQIHNNPVLGVARADALLPALLPNEFPAPGAFRTMHFEMALSMRDQVQAILDLVRRHTGRENVLFLIDEAGQYVAKRSELILNLDGLARNLKELGKGKAWIVATGQQTLTEIVESAAYNSQELGRMRDRFPIAIELDARDIREITYRRLLTKRSEGKARLEQLFQTHGQALTTHTRLTDTPLFKQDPAAADFVKFYPFLPQHFEVLMELIRVLARSTGGIGLRSAIRVMQDVLVDNSRILPATAPRLADRPVGTLATVEDFYLTLRADINRVLPHVVAAVDQVERLAAGDDLRVRVARAVAALQTLENFPKTAENIAALLYPALGSPALLDGVRQTLAGLAANKHVSLIEDPQTGGYQFLSESVGPLQKKRSEYVPTTGELARVRNRLLETLLGQQPAARLEGAKDVRAAVRAGKTLIFGQTEEIAFQLEVVEARQWDDVRTSFLARTAMQLELRNTVIWLYAQDDATDELIVQIRKSEKITGDINETTADKDVAQYARAERRLAERNRDAAVERLRRQVLEGIFVFRGKPTPVSELAITLDAAVATMLLKSAAEVFPQYALVKIQPKTNLAEQFLGVEHLGAMPADRDPLHLVAKQGGAPRVDVQHPALAETLRAFRDKVKENGGGSLLGSAVQDFFAEPPYGWSKDAVRYLLAALLVAGEIELRTGGETLKTAGPAAAAAMKSTVAFNKVVVALRGSRPNPELLHRAAQRLTALFGQQVLPLEERISQAARKQIPDVVEQCGALPDRLRLLGVAGEERAQRLLGQLTELLRGDASDAATRLGAQNSTLADDIDWARATTRVLNQGGEQDIRAARTLLAETQQLAALFPGVGAALIQEEEAEQLHAILQAEHFAEQLADVRTMVNRVRQRVREEYAAQYSGYVVELENASRRLEALPAWVRLTDADRAELAGKLAPALPQQPDAGNLLFRYQQLLAAGQGIANLEKTLAGEVAKRTPPPVVSGGANGDYSGNGGDDGDGAEPAPAIVPGQTLGDLLQKPIANEDELRTWLAEVTKHLRAALQLP